MTPTTDDDGDGVDDNNDAHFRFGFTSDRWQHTEDKDSGHNILWDNSKTTNTLGFALCNETFVHVSRCPLTKWNAWKHMNSYWVPWPYLATSELLISCNNQCKPFISMTSDSLSNLSQPITISRFHMTQQSNVALACSIHWGIAVFNVRIPVQEPTFIYNQRIL